MVKSGMHPVHEHPGDRNSRQSESPYPKTRFEHKPYHRSRKQARENSSCNRNNDCCNYSCHHVLPPFLTVKIHQDFMVSLTSLKSKVNCKFINYSMLHYSVLLGQCAFIACFIGRFAQVPYQIDFEGEKRY